MNKTAIHLTINPDILELAKAFRNSDGSKLNLSDEFEEWIRIRTQSNINTEPNVNPEIEIAKLRSEIARIQNESELQKKQDMQLKEEIMVLDNVIDNEIKFAKPEEIADNRKQGLQFLFRKKFNKTISLDNAKNMITNRMKERGLLNA